MKFEERLKTLENLVRNMESGKLGLDEMIESFEKGRVMASECRKELDEIKLRIEKVTGSGVEELTND
jgi:exodeoxyribonuclease VII small subunit